jgi:hypothetical protein
MEEYMRQWVRDNRFVTNGPDEMTSRPAILLPL